MKKIITIVTGSLFLAVFANSATINATNLNTGSGDTIVTDNAGNPISTDVYSFITTFDGGAAPATLAALAASTPTMLAANALIGASTPGAFSNAYSGAGGTGEAIYLILSDNASLSAAGFLGLINTGETLDADGASPDSNNYLLASGNGTVMFGAFSASTATADWTNATGGSNTGPTFQLAATIPEPSVSLLAGLGLLGLLRRRR